MYRPSKEAGEEYHPRRQLMVTGDKAFSLFLKWPQYLTLREELLQENGAFKTRAAQHFCPPGVGA